MYNSYNNQYYSQIPQTRVNTFEPNYNRNILQGRSVDSIDVVKAIEVPLDGSISYYPLTDGTAILTKKLQQDGTSKIIIFKPVEDSIGDIKYITNKDLDDIKNDIKELKKKLKNIKKEDEDEEDDD